MCYRGDANEYGERGEGRVGGGAEKMEGERAVSEGGNIWNKPLPYDITTVAIETIQLSERQKIIITKLYQSTYFSGCCSNDEEFPDVELVAYEFVLRDKEIG